MSSMLKPPVSKLDHFEGSLDAPIKLVEYGDYQCPSCGSAYPVIKRLRLDLAGKICFVFRNFPLSNAHEFARIAAIAAEAAALQHEFWRMHDALFQNQDALSDVFVYQLAQSIGLDMRIFEEDMLDDKTTKKVDTDFESGVRSGVNGTPTFFVNGQRYDDGVSSLYETLLSIVE